MANNAPHSSYTSAYGAGVTGKTPRAELTPTMSETIKNKLSRCAHQWGETWLYDSGKCCVHCGASIKMYQSYLRGHHERE